MSFRIFFHCYTANDACKSMGGSYLTVNIKGILVVLHQNVFIAKLFKAFLDSLNSGVGVRSRLSAFTKFGIDNMHKRIRVLEQLPVQMPGLVGYITACSNKMNLIPGRSYSSERNDFCHGCIVGKPRK